MTDPAATPGERIWSQTSTIRTKGRGYVGYVMFANRRGRSFAAAHEQFNFRYDVIVTRSSYNRHAIVRRPRRPNHPQLRRNQPA
jgi:hypothetical protein